jgi:hypothetical protein
LPIVALGSTTKFEGVKLEDDQEKPAEGDGRALADQTPVGVQSGVDGSCARQPSPLRLGLSAVDLMEHFRADCERLNTLLAPG